jgi:phosphotransferase system  glucose/maltose/N-acetylglucosamine-specific IIC component
MILYDMILYNIILYNSMSVLYYIVLCYVILYYIILHITYYILHMVTDRIMEKKTFNLDRRRLRPIFP